MEPGAIGRESAHGFGIYGWAGRVKHFRIPYPAQPGQLHPYLDSCSLKLKIFWSRTIPIH